MNYSKPGTDSDLRYLLRTKTISRESAIKWMREGLSCLETGDLIGNASNQTAKAMVAMGDHWIWEGPPDHVSETAVDRALEAFGQYYAECYGQRAAASLKVHGHTGASMPEYRPNHREAMKIAILASRA